MSVSFEEFPEVQRFGVCRGRFVEVLGGQEVVAVATADTEVEVRDVDTGEGRYVRLREVTLDPLEEQAR